MLLSRLGYGGMAEVFLARTNSIGGFEKLLAIKRLLPFCTEDEQTVELLADEAKITVRLTHPNIVQVFDFGKVDDSYYIAMEFVDGVDLKTLVMIDDLSSEPLPIDVALYTTISILDALAFAHERTDERGQPMGIIHRDVSPHNVLISRHGQVKLTDFGVARAAISRHVSVVGDIRGKFSYMPPEQACGGEIDQRIDIFATGAILYELLAGKQPYRSTSSGEQMALLYQDVGPPSLRAPGIPPALDAITLRALANAPQDRFPSAREFAAALREQLEQRHAAEPMAPQQRLARLIERRIREEQAEDGGSAGIEPMMTRADFSIGRGSLLPDDPVRATADLQQTRELDAIDEPSSPIPGEQKLALAETVVATVAVGDDPEPPAPAREGDSLPRGRAGPLAPLSTDVELEPAGARFDDADAVIDRPSNYLSHDGLRTGGLANPVRRARKEVQRALQRRRAITPPRDLRRDTSRPAVNAPPPGLRQLPTVAGKIGPETTRELDRPDGELRAIAAPSTASRKASFYVTAGVALIVLIAAVLIVVLIAGHDTPPARDREPAPASDSAFSAGASTILERDADAPSPPRDSAAAGNVTDDAKASDSEVIQIRRTPGPRYRFGYLTVRARPRARIEIDGRWLRRRRTPLRRLKVVAGRHRVRVFFLRRRRYSATLPVTVRPGLEAKLRFTIHGRR